MSQQHQIFIQSNQPIIILNASNNNKNNNNNSSYVVPTGNSFHQTNKATPIQLFLNSTENSLLKNLNKTESNVSSNMKSDLNNLNVNNERKGFYMQSNSKKEENDPKSVDQLTKLLSKYKVNDVNSLNTNDPPVSLIITPRGTADGYSIGIDYDNLLTEIPGFW